MTKVLFFLLRVTWGPGIETLFRGIRDYIYTRI